MYSLIKQHNLDKTKNLQNLFVNSTTSPKKIVDGLFAGLFAYDGWDIINFGIEEVEHPRRTMPLAIIIAMTLTALCFLTMNLSFFVVLNPSVVKNSHVVAIVSDSKLKFIHIFCRV